MLAWPRPQFEMGAGPRTHLKFRSGHSYDGVSQVSSGMHVEVLSAISDEAIAEHQQAADVYSEIGLIPRRIDVSQIYDRSFVLQPSRS